MANLKNRLWSSQMEVRLVKFFMLTQLQVPCYLLPQHHVSLVTCHLTRTQDYKEISVYNLTLRWNSVRLNMVTWLIWLYAGILFIGSGPAVAEPSENVAEISPKLDFSRVVTTWMKLQHWDRSSCSHRWRILQQTEYWHRNPILK